MWRHIARQRSPTRKTHLTTATITFRSDYAARISDRFIIGKRTLLEYKNKYVKSRNKDDTVYFDTHDLKSLVNPPFQSDTLLAPTSVNVELVVPTCPTARLCMTVSIIVGYHWPSRSPVCSSVWFVNDHPSLLTSSQNAGDSSSAKIIKLIEMISLDMVDV